MSYLGCETMITDVLDIRMNINARILELRFYVSVLEPVEDYGTVLVR